MAWAEGMSLLAVFGAAAAAGAVNAVAGGGTLLTFPTLLGVGLDSKAANATSTVGLWPGSLGGAWGFRREALAAGPAARWFYLVSFLGGVVGSWLMIATSDELFRFLVPWLILGATGLFAWQGKVQRRLAHLTDHHTRRWWVVVPVQFLVGVYGGYFGAGIGILMLATLGFLGIEDLNQRNGVKNVAALCINGVAVVLFVGAGLVAWGAAVTMAVGALAGGYGGSGLARRVGPTWVRRIVIAVGLAVGLWYLVKTYSTP